MPAQLVPIDIDRHGHSIKPGAARGQDLSSLTNVASGEQLLLEVPKDVDIPLAHNDVIFLRGGEKFSIGDGSPIVADNPLLRHPVTFQVNDAPFTSPHAKLTAGQIKQLVGAANVDLWADLDGIADELLEDDDRIVLQKVDCFFTVPREDDDRFYDVTVILDGEDAQRRFPASMTVREATRRSLPPADRPKVDEFDMVDGDIGTTPLDPTSTLKEAGVRDGHVLSITKKNGGGG